MVGLRRHCAPRNDGVWHRITRRKQQPGWLDCDVAAPLAMTGGGARLTAMTAGLH
ncbi:MAG: hypothetical protein HON55_03960, partial [Legionellales bacterium]|nr:hypothetical protein [Legionellales bacterium]